MELSPSEALVTSDGVLTGMSDIPDTHSIYKSDARMIQVKVPLRWQEQLLAEKIQSGSVPGSIQFSIRSFAAQSGLEGFEQETTEIGFDANGLVIDTLVTDLSDRTNGRLLRALRQLADGKYTPIVRAILTPKDSAIRSDQPVEEFLPDIESKPIQSILYPLEDMHYEIPHMTVAQLRAIFETRASGRKLLGAFRRERKGLPSHLDPGGFLVGKINVGHLKHHAMLDRETVINDETSTTIMHGNSRLLDADRPEANRQIEIVNVNGTPEPLHGRFVRARFYRAAQNAEEAE